MRLAVAEKAAGGRRTVTYTCSLPENQARLVRYLVLTLLVVSVLSVFGCLMGHLLATRGAAGTLFRLFGNTNYGAAYVLTVIPFSTVLTLSTPRPWEKALWGTTLFLARSAPTGTA
ncbi:MAG: hypothetical protein ACE5IQ_13850 [Candidatus Methylomirabilales bacterium]